jgi:hypothetical protein
MSRLNIFILLAIMSIILFSCNDKYSRKSHNRTTEIKKGLFVETFTVFGSGAFGTDLVTQYLTDSISFRKYIGTFDEGVEYYFYKTSGDTIHIEKYKSGQNIEPKKLLWKEQLFFSELQKTKTIE